MYRSGDFIEMPNGRTIRLDAKGAEIANAALAPYSKVKKALGDVKIGLGEPIRTAPLEELRLALKDAKAL